MIENGEEKKKKIKVVVRSKGFEGEKYFHSVMVLKWGVSHFVQVQ